jgi:arylsulfatase A-like enzyme
MPRPNILVFMTDQQRGDTIPPYSRARMPNLERFCSDGVTFTQAFCPSPHCCPSRATFFSGLYPSQHGVWNNVDVPNTLSRGLHEGVRLWSQDLRDSGYDMYFSGKWHVSSVETPRDRGWDMSSGVAAVRDHSDRYYHTLPDMREWGQYQRLAGGPLDRERGEGEILRPGYPLYTHYAEHEDLFRDQKVVSDAVEALRKRRGSADKPWCHFVGTLGPHDPYFAPQRFLDMYDVDDIELPESFGDLMGDKPGLYRRLRGRFDQLSEREHKEAIRHYLAFCSYEDYLFGQVLDALDESGQADNTLVLYISDHGDYVAEHGLWCKGLPCFKGAYHIPVVMRWPNGIEMPDRIVDALVSLADFAPTFLELAGVPIDRRMVGMSLTPFLFGKTPESWRDAVFTQSNGNELYGIQRSVMTKEWKFVYNGFDFDELYDLRSDPDETRNLASDPQYMEVIRQLSRVLWQFAYDTNDVCVNSYIATALATYGPGEAFA